MANKLSAAQVKHIAFLLNLPIEDEEIKTLESQLSEAVNYVEVLKELDLSNTLQTNQVTGLRNVYRDDLVEPSMSQEEALANARQTYDGYFMVPATIKKS